LFFIVVNFRDLKRLVKIVKGGEKKGFRRFMVWIVKNIENIHIIFLIGEKMKKNLKKICVAVSGWTL